MRFSGGKAVLTLWDHASAEHKCASKCRGLQGRKGEISSVLPCPFTQLLRGSHSTDFSRSGHPVDTLLKKHCWRR